MSECIGTVDNKFFDDQRFTIVDRKSIFAPETRRDVVIRDADEDRKIFQTIKNLVDKIDKVGSSEEFKGIFTFAYIHNNPYKGENWKNEMDALKEIIKERFKDGDNSKPA